MYLIKRNKSTFFSTCSLHSQSILPFVMRFHLSDNQTLILLSILAILLLWVGIGDMPLYILDEAKNAECAREMWRDGERIVPTFNEELRMDKPPLHYFFMKVAYSLFGVSAFSARFFSAFMGLLTVGSVFFYTRKWLGKKAAVFSVLALLSSLHFLFQFRLAVPDPYLIFCILGAVFAFHFGLEKENKWQLFLGYTLTALGCLAKGPVALGLVGLIMLLYLVLSRQLTWKALGKLQIPLGAIWFLLLAVPWYIAVGRATNGEWIEGFFFTHNMQRFSSAMEGHGGGFWVTWLFVFVGMLPFIVFLPNAVKMIWRESVQKQSFLWLCLIAAAVIIGFFTISTTKLPNYTVPAYPFLAVVLGWYLSRAEKFSVIAWLIILVISILLPIAVFWGIYNDPVVYYLGATALAFVPITIAAIISFYLQSKSRIQASILTLASGFMLTALIAFTWAVPRIFKTNPVQRSFNLLANKQEIITYKQFNPAYLFNLERTFENIDDPDALRDYLKAHPETYILTQTRYLRDFREEEFERIFEQKDLFEMQTSVVLRLDLE